MVAVWCLPCKTHDDDTDMHIITCCKTHKALQHVTWLNHFILCFLPSGFSLKLNLVPSLHACALLSASCLRMCHSDTGCVASKLNAVSAAQVVKPCRVLSCLRGATECSELIEANSCNGALMSSWIFSHTINYWRAIMHRGLVSNCRFQVLIKIAAILKSSNCRKYFGEKRLCTLEKQMFIPQQCPYIWGDQ